MNSMRRLFMNMEHCSERTFTRAQMGVVMMVAHRSINTVKGIAKHLGITPSAATQIVNGLVEAKMLNKTPDENDRRQVNLTLSSKGRAFLESSEKAMHDRFTKMLEPLTNEELNELTRIQKKIADSFRSLSEHYSISE